MGGGLPPAKKDGECGTAGLEARGLGARSLRQAEYCQPSVRLTSGAGAYCLALDPGWGAG